MAAKISKRKHIFYESHLIIQPKKMYYIVYNKCIGKNTLEGWKIDKDDNQTLWSNAGVMVKICAF